MESSCEDGIEPPGSINHVVSLLIMMTKSRRWADQAAKMKEGRSVFTNLTSKPTGNRFLGKPGRRWGKMTQCPWKIGINIRKWIDSAQDRNTKYMKSRRYTRIRCNKYYLAENSVILLKMIPTQLSNFFFTVVSIFFSFLL